MCSVMLEVGRPVIAAAAATAAVCPWVGAQISHEPSRTTAVAFIGSSVAWARYGTP